MMIFTPLKKYPNNIVSTLILSLLLLLALPAGVSAKLYKWVDENGNVYYSDKIPPKASQGAHSTLNKKGMTIDSKGAAKTAEEIQRDKELQELRKQQQTAIKQQQAKDKVLLKTFRSEDDLILARDGKLRSVDNLIGLTKGNIKRLKSTLATMQSRAATQEKAGEPVSEKHKEDMESVKRQIKQGYETIASREQTKKDIRREYDADIKRFRVLKKLNTKKDSQAIDKDAMALNTVFECRDSDHCDSAWEKAINYVEQHATTPLQLSGERIYMTEEPENDDDVSLTITRIKDKKTLQEKIFLDQQCGTSLKSQEFCESEVSQTIKRNFLPSLNE